ncbi:MAG: hypothetical protein EBU97_02185 [Rhodobacteraceae bacterium]|nr:hypothetical protein [Paracoccaceae bacterium]
MKKFATFAALAVIALVSGAGMATAAGVIEGACLKSERGAGQTQLCGCIQQAADMTLIPSDQRRAAKFFANPDEAQATLISKSASDDAFWDRYKAFGQAAEGMCGG